MALNDIFCADVPLRNYSPTLSVLGQPLKTFMSLIFELSYPTLDEYK